MNYTAQLKYIRRYLAFLLTAQTKYYLHSPFVFEFVNKVKDDKRYFNAFESIKDLRKELLASPEALQVTDLGAGSKTTTNKKTRKVSDLAKSVASSEKKGQLLFRLVNHFQPQKIVELGTSLGIGTAYLAAPSSKNEVLTIEGCPAIAAKAKANFDFLSLKNIQIFQGDFSEILPDLLKSIEEVDLVFFDGNHQKEPTIQYFNWCKKKIHENSIFVFDDIYWSKGMMEAWEYIKQQPEVQVSIDIFHLGIAFFKKNQAKQDFKLYFF